MISDKQKVTGEKSFREKVYEIVKKIPIENVATYGQLAKAVGRPGWARQVGWALHANKDKNTPCHRVVTQNGMIAKNYAFGGANVQRRKLLLEGVKFSDKMHVDLKLCLWQS